MVFALLTVQLTMILIAVLHLGCGLMNMVAALMEEYAELPAVYTAQSNVKATKDCLMVRLHLLVANANIKKKNVGLDVVQLDVLVPKKGPLQLKIFKSLA